MALFSNNNAMLIDKCSNLHNLTVTLAVTADQSNFGDAGFSLQLNAYPPKGQLSQGQTLTWLQYILYVQNGSAAVRDTVLARAIRCPWLKGYVPNPPNTLSFLPVLPNVRGRHVDALRHGDFQPHRARLADEDRIVPRTQAAM